MKTKYFNSILEKRSIILLIAIISLICCNWTITNAQDDFCYFDDYMADMIDEHPEMIQKMQEMETEMQEMMENNQQAIMNDEVYSIPVVFHIIHLGELEGNGSNISDARINQALQDLNDDFRDVLDTAYDVKIEFCLAERDPSGNLTDGINRVDGSTVTDYSNLGIAPGHNELDVKSLSRWPNEEYINIWVVQDIHGAPGSQILGYATFPGTAPAFDGIVLLDDATGTSTYSRTISHEAGHYFNLYHTFHGGDESTCPPNGDCDDYGDMICDTDPHKKPSGGCPTGTNPCAMDPIDEVSRNHMNYTDNSCRNAFTGDQAMRMRCALITQRPSLMNSLGCDTPCTEVFADFTVPDVEFNIGANVTFTNTSTGGINYSWKINGKEESTNTDFSYTFDEGGIYEVCLYASDTTFCVNQKCTTITVIPICNPPADSCQEVKNWNFEQISEGLNVNSFKNVCGWKRVQSTPFFCKDVQNNSIGLWLRHGDNERITTENKLDLNAGGKCFVSFDYWVTLESPPAIQLALVDDNDIISDRSQTLPASAEIIAEINYPQVDDPTQNNNQCPDPSAQFHTYYTMVENVPDDKYLTITGDGNYLSIVFIDNVSINCCGTTGCEPEPDFTYDFDGCSVIFNGTNTGDPGMYSWDFGDGTQGTGQDVTHEYMYGGVFRVCLTITCDVETSYTICKDITISEECNTCEDETVSVSSTLCEESGSGENTYTANFNLEVPNGYKFCDESNPFIHTNPNKVNVEVWSVDYDESDPNTDNINIGIEITEASGYNFGANGATGKIILCGPNGETMCYTLALSGSACDYCYDLSPVTMDCEDTDPFDGEFYYEGSLDISGLALPIGLKECSGNEITSADNGFEFQNVTEYGIGNYTIDFSFTTKQAGEVNTSAVFCLTDNEDKFCFNVRIAVDPCDTLPTDCVQQWDTKNMECDTVIGDSVIVNISKTMSNHGYQICSGGLYASIEGGLFGENDAEVVVNSWGTPTAGTFSFDVDIILPIDYYQSETYDLRIYLCDGEGNIVCFLFPFQFSCDIESFEGGDAELRSSDMSPVSNSYSVFPNPADDRIYVDSHNWNERKRSNKIRLIDNLGNVIYKSQLTSKTMDINVSGFAPGLYYIIILDDEDSVFSKRVVIMN